jgi:YesN/AraC family two-component response regulator
MMHEKSVLFIDDDEHILAAIRRTLLRHGFKVFTACNAEDAYSILEKHDIPVIVSDQEMPVVDGTTLLARIRKKYPKTIRMILSGNSDFTSLQRAINIGEITKFLQKPCAESELIKELEAAFITYEKSAKKKPQQSKSDHIPEFVVATNLFNLIESANLSFYLASGYSKDEIAGKDIWSHFLCAVESKNKQEIMYKLVQDRSWEGNVLSTLKNGNQIKLHLCIAENQNISGKKALRSYRFYDPNNDVST